MKSLLTAIVLLVSINSYCQTYIVGLLKTGKDVKNIEGEIIVKHDTLISTIDGQSKFFKVTSRKGFTIHVTDGTSEGKYVINHAKGRLHGFTYDRAVHYHEKHHTTSPTSVFLCLVKRDSTAVK